MASRYQDTDSDEPDAGPSKPRCPNITMSVESTPDEESSEQKSSEEESSEKESSEEESDEENAEEEGVGERGAPTTGEEKDELEDDRNGDGDTHEQTLDTIATKVSDTPTLIAECRIHMPMDM